MPLYTKIILYSLSNILQKIILKMKNKNRVGSIEEKIFFPSHQIVQENI